MAIKIFIKTNDDSSFLFKNEANPGFVAKPKTYELELVPTQIRKHKADETKEYTVRCINLYTKNVLFEAVKVSEIDVNGTVYPDYATLSAALAGLVFKKGGGGGSGAPELDTLETVVNRGNHSPKYITFTGGNTGEDEINGALGMNTTTYSMYFGNMNPTHTGTWNIGVGYNTLNKLSSGTENTAFGHYSLSNLTVGTENIAIGNLTLNSLAGTDIESRWNIAIGENVGRHLPKASGNVFIGTYTAKNLSSGVTEAELSAISPAAAAYLKLVPDQSGYNATAGTFNTSLNTFAGQSINETTTTPTRAVMSTIIGASGLYNVKFRNFNNIVVGAGNYMTVYDGTMYNSIVIGNCINLPNQVDTLAIGLNRAGRINAADAIIYGLLPNTQLTFNAPITVPSAYMRNAQGDSTYTKQLVAKPNGDIGWENKMNSISYVNTTRYSYYSGNFRNMATANGFLNMIIGGSILSSKDLTTITGQENYLFTYSDSVGLTSGRNNLGIGYLSGSELTTGSDNVFLGRRCGRGITTGYNNIIIGSFDTAWSDVSNNILNIGDTIKGDLSTKRVNLTTLNLISQSSFPTAQAGDIIFKTPEKKHFGFDGTTWNPLY